MICTSTPRLTARTSASLIVPSGTKYGLVSKIDERAPSRARKNSRYASAAPLAGELLMVCATRPPRGSISGKYAAPESSTPVASRQFSAKAAWIWRTIGPSMRTSV